MTGARQDASTACVSGTVRPPPTPSRVATSAGVSALVGAQVPSSSRDGEEPGGCTARFMNFHRSTADGLQFAARIPTFSLLSWLMIISAIRLSLRPRTVAALL
jgi:hypothetical protein